MICSTIRLVKKKYPQRREIDQKQSWTACLRFPSRPLSNLSKVFVYNRATPPSSRQWSPVCHNPRSFGHDMDRDCNHQTNTRPVHISNCFESRKKKASFIISFFKISESYKANNTLRKSNPTFIFNMAVLKTSWFICWGITFRLSSILTRTALGADIFWSRFRPSGSDHPADWARGRGWILLHDPKSLRRSHRQFRC